MRHIYPVAVKLAATLNSLAEMQRDVHSTVTAEDIISKATDEEIMFFYVRMCL